jgi:hypothetical protein
VNSGLKDVPVTVQLTAEMISCKQNMMNFSLRRAGTDQAYLVVAITSPADQILPAQTSVVKTWMEDYGSRIKDIPSNRR